MSVSVNLLLALQDAVVTHCGFLILCSGDS